MKVTVVLLIWLFIPFFTVHARQSPPVLLSGKVTSDSAGTPLSSATVSVDMLVNKQLHLNTFTDSEGRYSLQLPGEGRYILQVRFIGFASYMDTIVVQAGHSTLTLGIIQLPATGIVLKEVEIKKQRQAVRIKKDTVEFDAEAFHTRQAAALSELLKKLPGLEIAEDGSMRFNGVPISDVMVNGHAFFNSDPSKASTYLLAEMVDRIQLMDKKSDHAQLTGIPDADKSKSINILLKDSYDNSYSGEITGGAGTDSRYTASGNLNSFSKPQQWSLIGSMDNTNGISPGDASSGGATTGLNKKWTAGGNFSRHFGEQHRLSVNYIVAHNDAFTQEETFRQNILADSSWDYQATTGNHSNAIKHRIETKLESGFDSTQKLSFNLTADFSQYSERLSSDYQSLLQSHQELNSGLTQNDRDQHSFNLSAHLGYAKKFSKKGRSLSFSLLLRPSSSDERGLNYSRYRYAHPDGQFVTDTFNQSVNVKASKRLFLAGVNYTEPLWKDYFLELGYTFCPTTGTTGQEAFSYQAASGRYDVPIDSLTRTIHNDFTTNVANTGLLILKKKFDARIAVNLIRASLGNVDPKGAAVLRNTYHYLFPFGGINYHFNDRQMISLNFWSSYHQPPPEKLLAARDYSNPLYIRTGNPDLQPEIFREASIFYSTVNRRTSATLFSNLNFRTVGKKIVDAISYDSAGRQVIRPVNGSGSFAASGSIAKTFRITASPTYLSLKTDIELTRDGSLINGQQASAWSLSIKQQAGYEYAVKDLLDAGLRAGLVYASARYPYQSMAATNYFTWTINGNVDVELPLGFRFGGTLDFLANTGRAGGFNSTASIVNLNLMKTCLAQKQLVFRLLIYDLLKQNKNLMRQTGIGYIEDTRSNVLGRFGLLSVGYYFKPRGR